METETRVDVLIDRWERMRDQGAPLTIEELCAECSELATEVRHRIEALQAMDSALDTEVSDTHRGPGGRDQRGAGPDRGLPEVLRATAVYRPRCHHNQGGLGDVFTAYQEELDRTVALKRIRPDKLRDVARRRFLREAALTARLQHPGIVPIYDLGHDEGGPFYTMPFIQGQTFQEAIEAFHGDETLRRDPGPRSLKFRGLLQQFIAACNAVAYAHDQGVVHRDLKPSNIMLGPYGETLVMDWGLAKRFGGGDDASESGGDTPLQGPSSQDFTATGEVLGTPQYMSPEQALGEPSGPAGDVFSLGLVLYAILTGRSAFERSSFRGADGLKAVREAAIVPPRARDPRLSTALEAVCLRALAARAEDRYASARALADDLTRWLADEPVTARREPVSIRVQRWARRHRTAMAAAVIAVLTGAVGLSAVVGVQARANTRLKQALDQTTKAQAATREALAQSEESRQQAEAVSQFLVEAFRSPDPSQDGRQIKVANVLDRAAARLDKDFAGSQATRGALLDALGRTYFGLGLFDKAVNLHTSARAVQEAVLGPDHPVSLRSRNNLAADYATAGRLSDAIPLFEVTLSLRESKLGPDDPDTLASRNNLAAAYHEAGRTAQAIALHEATLKRRESKQGPDHPDTLASRNNLANAYLAAGRTADAITLHEGTLKLREAKLGPDHPDTLISRNNLAAAYCDAGRTVESIALHEATLELCQTKLGPDHRFTLFVRNNLAAAYCDAGRTVESIALHEATLSLRESKLGPDHSDTLISRNNLAAAYEAAGRLSEAIPLFEATVKLRESNLGLDHPDTLASRNHLANAYGALGRSAEAEVLYRDVLARRRKAVKPDSPLLASDLVALGHLLLEQSRWSEAEALLREALAIHEKANPDDWARYDAMSQLGGALEGQGRHAEAEPRIVAGYEGMKVREARIAAPDRSRLREAAERVIHLYEAWDQPETAAAWKTKMGIPDLPSDIFARP